MQGQGTASSIVGVLPRSLLEWLTLFGMIFTAMAVVVRWFDKRAKDRAEALELRLTGQIDKIGTKVNGIVVNCGQHETQLDNLDSRVTVQEGEQRRISERLGEFAKGQSELKEQLRQDSRVTSEALKAVEVAMGKVETEIKHLANGGGR